MFTANERRARIEALRQAAERSGSMADLLPAPRQTADTDSRMEALRNAAVNRIEQTRMDALRRTIEENERRRSMRNLLPAPEDDAPPSAADLKSRQRAAERQAAVFQPTSDMYLDRRTAEAANAMQEISDRSAADAKELKQRRENLYGDLNDQRRQANRAFLNTVLSTPTGPYAPGRGEEAWAEYNENARKLKQEEDKLHAMGGAGDYEIIPGAVRSAHAGYLNAAATVNDFFNQYHFAPTVFNPDGSVNWEASVRAHKPNESVQAAVDNLHGRADALQEQATNSITGAKAGRGRLGNTLIDAAVSGTQMAGDALINTVLPGAGLTAMGVRAFGSAAQDARQRGADVVKQMGYGAAVAGVEVLSEKLFDGLAGIYGSGLLDKASKKVKNFVEKMVKTEGGKQVLNLLKSAGEEGVEELFSGIIDPALDTIIDGERIFGNDRWNKETWDDVWHSVLVGAILGGFGGTVELVSGRNADAEDAAKAAAAEREYRQQANNTINWAYDVMQKYGANSEQAQVAREVMKQVRQNLQNMERKEGGSFNQTMPTQQEYEDARAGEAGRFFSGMGSEAVQAVIDEGLDSEPGTESRRLAEEYDKKIKAGSQLTPEEIGKQYRANIEAIDAENLREQQTEQARREKKAAADKALEYVRTAAEEDGIGENGARAAAGLYRLTQREGTDSEAKSFYAGFKAVYDAAVKGESADSVTTEAAQALSQDVRESAYQSGLADAGRDAQAAAVDKTPNERYTYSIRESDGKYSVIVHDNQSGTDSAVGRYAQRVDADSAIDEFISKVGGVRQNAETGSNEGQQRNAGVPQRKGRPGIRERAEATGARKAAGKRRAESIRTFVAAQRLQEVSPRGVGIENGAGKRTLRVIPRAMEAQIDGIRMQNGERVPLAAIRQSFAARGVDAIFVSGDIELTDGSPARGAYSADGTKVFIQIDDTDATAEQIAAHEDYHVRKRLNPGLQERVREAILRNHDDAELEQLCNAYVNAYGWGDWDAAAVLEEVLADAYAGIDVFDYLDYYEGATRFSGDVRQSVEENDGEQQEARGPPAGEGKNSRIVPWEGWQSYELTDEFIERVPADERHTFLRELATKTSKLKKGQKQRITINTADHLYLFSANGYMNGHIVEQIDLNADIQYAKEARREFLHGTDKDAENADLWADAVSRYGRESRSGFPFSAQGRGGNGGNDKVSGAERESDRAGYTDRAREDSYDEENVENYGPGTIYYDGKDGYIVEEDGGHTKITGNGPTSQAGKTVYSLKPVAPVESSSGAWTPGATFDEVKAAHPTLFELAADEAEVRNPTQITGTVKTYRKIYDILKAEGFKGKILDASSGLGVGTEAGRSEYGFDVDDIEPFPDAKYEPRYTDYSKLNKKYDAIISNAVLNVIPQDLRDAMVVKIGQLLAPGGRAFINVRGTDVRNASSKVAINEDGMEYFISDSGSYQKGFRKPELKAYLEDALGDGFSVELTNQFGGVAAIVTKNGNAAEITPENVDKQPIPPAEEMLFSRRLDSDFMDAAEKSNKKTKNVAPDVMAQARADRETIREYLERVSDLLPEDIEGNTWYSDSSYGGTEENTTICPRTMAYEEFMDAIAEELGRPLTVEDTVFISQEAMALTDKPECLYCYVAMDRKAYREYLGKYIEQRDAFLKDVKDGMEVGLVEPMNKAAAKESGQSRRISKDTAYGKFLNGRDNTENMYRRAKMWMDSDKLITKKNVASIAKMNSAALDPDLRAQIEDAQAYAQAASWAKKKYGYTAYNNHILKWDKRKVNKLNKAYGLRMYSFSDYSPAFILENMQMITDASVKGLKGLAYTKELDFVRIFAPSGVNINISVFGYNDWNTGNIAMDAMQGADWEQAKALRDQYSNVGCTFVATNDAQVEWALAQDWIDVVIPFHIVRTGANVASMFGWTNYTDMESDRKNPNWKEGNKDHIYPSEHQNDKSAYLELCEENNLTPRFEKWVENPNYMKLVNETRQSEAETQPLQPVFDLTVAEQSIDEMVKRGGYVQHIGGTSENMGELARETAKKISGKQKLSRRITAEQDEALNTQENHSARLINPDMSEEDREQILREKQHFHAAEYRGQAEAQIHDLSEKLNSRKMSLIKEAIRTAATELHLPTDLFNNDMQLEVYSSIGALKESSNKQIDNVDQLVRVIPVLREAVRDAIGIEAHTNRYFADNQTVYFANLLGGYVDGEAFVPVRFGIKASRDGKNTLYVLIGDQKIKKAEVVKPSLPETPGSDGSRSAYNVNIASLAKKIKHKDILKYLPDGMLSEDQRSAKWEAIAETIRYTNDKNDRAYAKAIQRGDLRSVQAMVNAAAKAAGYPVRAWHQTARDFTVFNTDNPGAALNDSETPNGIFFKTNDHDIGLEGKKQMPMYIDPGRMLDFKDRKEANAWYRKNVDGYDEISKKMESVIKPLDDEMQSIEERMFAAGTTDEEYDRLDKEWNGLLEKMHVEEDKCRGQLRELLNDYFLGENRPYDSIHLGYDGHRYVDGKRENVETYIVFSNSQAKSADPITYDDDGNIIPLSERFNREKQDIRYSRKPSNEDRLEKQNEDLRQRVEYWKGQTKHTKVPTARDTDVNRAAKGILEAYNSTLKPADVAPGIKGLTEYIMNEPGLTWGGVKERAYEIARDIIDSAEVMVNDDGGLYDEIRDRMRKPMKISSQDVRDITPDKWGDWRNQNRGKVNVSINGAGTPVDTAYAELSEKYPWLYPEDIHHPADQVLRMVEVMDELEPVFRNPYSRSRAEAIELCANDLIETAMSEDIRQTPPTYADRMEAKIAEAKARGAQKVAEVREQKNEQIKQIRAENAQRVAELLAREREARDKKVAALKEHYADQKQAARERKADSDARSKLLKIAKRLNNKKLPAVTRARLGEIIGDLDLVSKGITGKSVENLTALRDWYDDQKRNNPDFIGDTATEEKIARLSKRHIADLSAEEVAELTEVLLNLENEIRTQRQLIDSEERRDIYQQGVDTIENIRAAKPKHHGGLVDKYIITETLSPVRAMRRYTGYAEDDPLYQRTLDLADGQRKMFDYQMRAGKPFQKYLEDKQFIDALAGKKAEWIDISGYGEGGKPVKARITPAMRMSLYLHSLNDENLRHIRDGGVTIPDQTLYEKGKIAEAYAEGVTVKLTPSAVRAITDGMSVKERAFAKAAHDYFNGMSRDEINAVSEKLKGYSIASVEDYFPINTDTAFTKSDFESLKFDGTLEGMGFLKERKKARNPIMLRDMNDVLTQSINMHSKYVGLAIPVRNFNKVWNVTTVGADAEGNRSSFENSVQKEVSRSWGKDATDYIEKMMTDLQNGGGKQNSWSKVLGKLRSNYAQAVLTLNLSVAMKQAASYPTAAAVIGWGPLAKAMGNMGKVDLALIEKYTPLQWYRSQGFSSQELGDMAKRGVKLPPALNWVQGIDLLTTRKLWKASEYYVQQNNKSLKVGSDEYYKAVADVYNQVIEETQPNYTTMQRPQLLRSDDTLMSNVVMFKTQPMQNFNILYDAFGNMLAKERAYENTGTDEAKAELREARKRAVWAVESQIASLAVFAAMTLAWAKLRGKDDKYKDKDGNITLGSTLGGIGKDMLSGAMGMVPLGTEAYDILASKAFGDKYYGIEAVTPSMISDFVTKGMQGFDAISDAIRAIVKGEKVDWNEMRLKMGTVVDAATKIFGIPEENIKNLFNLVFRQTATRAAGKYAGEYAYLRLTTNPNSKASAFYDNLFQAYLNSPEQYGEILQDMLDSGDFDEEKIKDAMEKKMKDEQGVTKVDDLEQRWMTPTQRAQYDGMMAGIEGTGVYKRANDDQLAALESAMYDYVIGNSAGQKTSDKIAGGASVGLDADEYWQYLLALQVVDKPTESGKMGTYNSEEYEAAIRMVEGLDDAERSYLWSLSHSSDKNDPWAAKTETKTPAKTATTGTKTPAKTETKTEEKKEEKPKVETVDVSNSTAISAAKYDPSTQTAYITFKSTGKTYTYEGITPEEWENFKNAKSRGSYVRNWK